MGCPECSIGLHRRDASRVAKLVALLTVHVLAVTRERHLDELGASDKVAAVVAEHYALALTESRAGLTAPAGLALARAA